MGEEPDADVKPEVGNDNMVKKPCNDCPYRRKSWAGWTGDATPEEFMAATFGEEAVDMGGQLVMMPRGAEYPMPCHQTIDYTQAHWKDKWEEGWDTGEETGSLCAGAAIMFANRCKLPRHLSLPKREADRENVFTTPQEFIAHHRGGDFQSWSDDDDVG